MRKDFVSTHLSMRLFVPILFLLQMSSSSHHKLPFVDDFLYKRKDHQTGILQRFIDPAGGGKQNSQIRAICTPKMCVLERRKTKQDLHDARFGLYERAVTFEGPEVYSTSLPIRGAALPGRLKGLCQRVLSNISEATSSMNRTKEEDLRMVLNLKLDSKEKIWLLYSSSVRFVPRATKFLADVPSHEMTAKGAESLNIEEVIKLSPSIKLTQNANHDPSFVISNKNTFNACPSCSNMKVRDNFQPVPYKTIISHYEKVMELSRNLPWPPHPDIIKSAGGVGFGSLKKRKVDDICDDDIVIPPVIRHLHPRLKVEGYRMFRTDPLFLHKTSQVCEECFLSYAKLVTTSFQINKPIQLHTEMRGLGFASSAIRGNLKSGLGQSKWKKLPSNIQTEKHMASSLLKDLFVQGPSLPPAIVDPPEIELEHDKKKFMPLPYHYIESTHQPLLHLIDAKKKLSKKRLKRDQQKPKLNPYEIPLCIVESDLRCTKATAKKMTRDTRDKGDEGTNTNTGQLSPAHNATNANDITTNSLTVNSSRMINDETIEMLSKMLDEM